MRIVVIIFGVAAAAAGGVIVYRALFVEPHAAVVITDTSVRELPNMTRAAVGLVLLAAGVSVALFAALRRR